MKINHLREYDVSMTALAAEMACTGAVVEFWACTKLGDSRD